MLFLSLRCHGKTVVQIRDVCRALWFGCLAFGCAVAANAAVVQETVHYPPGAIAGWSSIDFDGDGVPELSFENYAIGHESGGVMFLEVHGSQGTQVLLQDGRVLPLQVGDTASLTPVLGQWHTTGLQNAVWSYLFSTLPDALPPLPGQGVGMPGCGDFMGVRFMNNGDWHYGWVRFGLLDATSLPLPQPYWPSVLEYAYETLPNTPVLIPEPSTLGLLWFGWTVLWLRVSAEGRLIR